MPCGRHEYENAVEEGARFIFQAAPVAVLGSDQRRVTGLRLVRTELGLMESIGPRPFLIRSGSEFEAPADLVVLALGFDPLPCRTQATSATWPSTIGAGLWWIATR